ncbi:CAP domain-containing protein [Maritimibacter sp. UBA3975]|uniref:CAP domain-containing protein n=1 Tax=Maritimibacter sp. UBA3975 TaxID=1946833 RepID=UPI0025BBA749|nr:CAP domain-containing protein [Maritimibacter sp. UBA3975]|tara:strand:+ start:30819 stop:31382 length:564 start_codon:yes stop_codon:yes gene_type:complete
MHFIKTLVGVAAVSALSGCMGGTSFFAPPPLGGERLDPNAPAWALNSYLPDPTINTAIVGNATQDASFSTLFSGVRTSAGEMPLTWNQQLDNAAQSYAGYLVATNQFSHNAGKSDIGARVAATGYQYRKVGENLAQGQQSEQQAMTSWQNSPGHNANLLDPDFEEFALGVSGTGQNVTWVLVLADPL